MLWAEARTSKAGPKGFNAILIYFTTDNVWENWALIISSDYLPFNQELSFVIIHDMLTTSYYIHVIMGHVGIDWIEYMSLNQAWIKALWITSQEPL